MKRTKLFLSTLIIGATATMLIAQENRPPQGNRPQGGPPSQGNRPSGGQQRGPAQGGQGGGEGRPGQGGPGAQGGSGQRGERPPFPLVDAIDANHDRVIDASEIANASANLKKLDKNGDGKLTADEFAPRIGTDGGRGPGQGGPSGGPSSQGQRERPKSE